MALDFPVGTDFPANGDQIPDGHEHNGFYWDATVGVWKRVCDGGERYLLAHGDNVEDANELVSYHWTQGVYLKGVKESVDGPYIVLTPDSAVVDSPNGTINLIASGAASITTESSFYTSAENDIFMSAAEGGAGFTAKGYASLRSTEGNVELLADLGDVELEATTGSEKVNRTIDDDADIKQITNKEYVDVKDEELRQNIIELEEEINAIAPSVEYGVWEWANPANSPRPPVAGTFHLLDAAGALTTEYKNVKFIKIHNDEYVPPGSTDPVDTHTWTDADPGKLIQLFDQADPDFLLGEIVATTPDTESVVIEVQLVQTSGVPNDNAVGGVFLSRVNIFSAPTGGDAGDFVRKQGDEMAGPGPLVIKTKKTSISYNGAGSNTAFIRFENDNNGTKRTTDLYLAGGNSNRLCVNYDFQSKAAVYSSGAYLARSSTASSTSADYYPRVLLDSDKGTLTYNTAAQLTWGSKGVTEIKANENNGDKGTVFKRHRGSSSEPRWQGVVDIDPSGTERCVGELWYNANDGVLYLRVS